MKRKNEKDHRERKSMGAKEFFDKQRAKQNAARPQQTWVGGATCKDGGHWTRDEFCKHCGAGIGKFRRDGEETCPQCMTVAPQEN